MYDGSNVSVGTTEVKGPSIAGLWAFLLWRAAYWTMQVSVKNKVLICMYWIKTLLFGRDISRF